MTERFEEEGSDDRAAARDHSTPTSRSWMLGLGVFALALAVRVVRYPLVSTPDGVDFPYLGDLFYHARRIWFSVVHFPSVLTADPYVSFPDGAEIVWPGVYDWVVAGVARALVGAESQAAVESVAIWFPPLFGAATAALAALLTARLYGLVSGAVAGALFSLLPASFLFSQLGQIDHHFAVAFVATVALASAIALLRDASTARTVGFGATMAGLVGLWPGALLHVLILQVALLAWMLGSESREGAVTRAGRLALAHVIAGLLLAPFGLGHGWEAYGSWSPWVLSNFQPVWFFAASGALLAAGRVFAGTSLGSSPARRVGVVAGPATVAALAALAIVPELRDAVREASGWFSQAEEFQEHVNELRPLLYPKGVLDLAPVVSEFGLLALPFPLALVGLALARRRNWRAEDALVVFFTTAFLVLTLNQRRFQNTFGVAYAMVWGAAVGQLAPPLWRQLAGRRMTRTLVATTSGILLFVAVWSLAAYYVPYVSQIAQLRRGVDPPRNAFRVQQMLFERAGRFLATGSPPTRGYLDPTQEPEYGVLSNWGVGHLLRYRSERPMVQDNFGVYGGRRTYDQAWAYFAAIDENTAIEIAGRLRARYVVADPLGAGSLEPYPPDSLARRLAQHFGSERELPRGRGRVAALTQHRLVFHTSTSPLSSLIIPKRDPTVSVWEIVLGARVEGSASPGSEVVASLPLSTTEGRSHVYQASTRAGEDGAWSLTVPYATDTPPSPAVQTAKRYRVTAGQATAAFTVSDADVRSGATVVGPDL